MRENVPEVAASTIVSSVGGLYGTAALVRMMRISDHAVRLSLLSRNITSPLAMAIASMLGANASLAVTMVVVTGLFGANFGASILDALGVRDGVARGLGIGEQVGLAEATFGSALAMVTSLVPLSAFANFGTFEAGWVGGFGLFGVARDTAVATGVGLHVVQLLHVVLLGVLGHVGMALWSRRNPAVDARQPADGA